MLARSFALGSALMLVAAGATTLGVRRALPAALSAAFPSADFPGPAYLVGVPSDRGVRVYISSPRLGVTPYDNGTKAYKTTLGMDAIVNFGNP